MARRRTTIAPATARGEPHRPRHRRRSGAARASGGFWLLFASFFVCGASTNGLIGTHLISYCVDHGIPEVQRREPAGGDGRLRSHRHHRLRLALRPLRQPLAAVLVLRAARPVAAVPALFRLLALRAVDLRGVLRPRLDRDRAADGAAHHRASSARRMRRSSSAGCWPAISSAPASPRWRRACCARCSAPISCRC